MDKNFFKELGLAAYAHDPELKQEFLDCYEKFNKELDEGDDD
jgi:hypothetical protein